MAAPGTPTGRHNKKNDKHRGAPHGAPRCVLFHPSAAATGGAPAATRPHSGRSDEPEDGLGAHVEQQVEHAEVGPEAVAAGEDLIVGPRLEGRVGQRVLGVDGVAVVVGHRAAGLGPGQRGRGAVARGRAWRHGGAVGRGVADGGVYVEQAAHRFADGLVEVAQVLPAALEEGAQVVGVILEEGRLAVGRHQGVPVQMAPVAVVADAHVAREQALPAVGALHGHCERLQAVGRGYYASVAVGLLTVGVAALYEHAVVAAQLLVPLHGAEVSCGE